MAPSSNTPDRPGNDVGAALQALGRDLRTGGRDLFGDLETLMRSTRRDAAKLVKALRVQLRRRGRTA
jgi:hypothetical protein